MTWTGKAKLQRAICALPEPLARSVYRALHRLYRGWRPLPPRPHIECGLRLARSIQAYRRLPGATVLEVGTGQRMDVPIVLWLLGADRLVCVDLHPNIVPERLRYHLDYYRSQRTWLAETLAASAADGSAESAERLDALLALRARSAKALVERVLALCNISYLAPADAVDLDLPERTFDVHCSNHVLEHLSEAALRGLLGAAARLLKPSGLCVHLIDLEDHFAKFDKTISAANFLQFDEAAWSRYAGNEFMYTNRLRLPTYRRIFAECGFDVLGLETAVDPRSLELLKSGQLRVAEPFRGLDPVELATAEALFVGRHDGGRQGLA